MVFKHLGTREQKRGAGETGDDSGYMRGMFMGFDHILGLKKVKTQHLGRISECGGQLHAEGKPCRKQTKIRQGATLSVSIQCV